MAMTSTDIANMALAMAGTKLPIGNINEVRPEAKQTNLFYNPARRQCLEAHNWGFARRTTTMALHGEPADLVKWIYRYQYPQGCLKFRYFVNPAGPNADVVPYEIRRANDGTLSIQTNLADAVGVWTEDVEDISMFTPTFIQALATLLAHLICFPLTLRQKRTDDLLGMYLSFMAAASTLDSNEGVGEKPRDAEAIRARA